MCARTHTMEKKKERSYKVKGERKRKKENTRRNR